MTAALLGSENDRPRLRDATIAFGLAGLSILAVVGGANDVGQRGALSFALLMLESLPLLFRRRWPIPVLVVVVVATLGHVFIADSPTVSEGLGALVAIYTVAERFDRRMSVAIAVAVGVAFAVIIAVKGGLPGALQSVITTEVTIGLAWAFGDWARTRRLYAVALEDRTRLLEAEGEERDRRAVLEERERIARELHDVVTHHVSVIVIQAGAATRALERRPDQAAEALGAIDRTARQALLDMRRMLGILGQPGSEDDGRSPMPGLDQLGELLEQVRASGLPVELSMTGERRTLDAGVELSAYRIIQEALTNALRHARGARARVALGYQPRVLTIEVVDEGGSGAADLPGLPSGSRGILGMRERVAMLGGQLEAGPTPTGFRVAASLPLEPSQASAR